MKLRSNPILERTNHLKMGGLLEGNSTSWVNFTPVSPAKSGHRRTRGDMLLLLHAKRGGGGGGGGGGEKTVLGFAAAA